MTNEKLADFIKLRADKAVRDGVVRCDLCGDVHKTGSEAFRGPWMLCRRCQKESTVEVFMPQCRAPIPEAMLPVGYKKQAEGKRETFNMIYYPDEETTVLIPD
jgi:hypothetical protein